MSTTILTDAPGLILLRLSLLRLSPSATLPPSLLYFAGAYVENSYGGQAGQALSEIEGACQKVRRRTRQYQPSNENNRHYKSLNCLLICALSVLITIGSGDV